MGNLGFQEILLIIMVVGGLALLPAIFYLLTLQNTLKAVSPENRRMPPGQVWLLLIPLFSLVWSFIVVNAIADSLMSEYEKQGVLMREKPTYNIGLTLAILQACSIIPLLGIIASLGALVCWIIYWVKVNECKNEIPRLRFENEIANITIR